MGIFSNRNINENPLGEMSFIQHLEALRWHLIRSIIVIGIFTGVYLFFSELLFDKVIFAPRDQSFPTYGIMCRMGQVFNLEKEVCITVTQKKLQTLGASEQFTTYIWICFLAGLITGFPYLLYEIWKFVKPALKDTESRPVRGFVFIGSFLFATGVVFGFYVLFPLSYNFLISFNIGSGKFVETNNTLDDYVSLISTMCLLTGLVFEMPIIVHFLTRLGIFTPQFMRKYRKHAVVVILIIAAFITPSPDIMSQLIVFAPLYVLYEISIIVSARTLKNMNARQLK
ncbi:MAG: twin-arginine translocase subunit TatC [Bacteroidota bacterium]|jgi:sec-independent protein translocase protein TatC